jgi:uncharacterized membrane protein YhiD involved in acid resistance
MPDFLIGAVGQASGTPGTVLLRLIAAMILGGLVVAVYRATRAADESARSFAVTLVLLSVLIAMVTQVIGDSVARAFSLVGALSIVRFRTVVRDTQDTAYVIFAVAVGMAAGAGHGWLAVSGLGVTAVAALLMRRVGGALSGRAEPYLLDVRLGLGREAHTVLAPAFDEHLLARHVVSIETARQGMALQLKYRVALRDESAADQFVKALNRIEGVQGVALQRLDAAESEPRTPLG